MSDTQMTEDEMVRALMRRTGCTRERAIAVVRTKGESCDAILRHLGASPAPPTIEQPYGITKPPVTTVTQLSGRYKLGMAGLDVAENEGNLVIIERYSRGVMRYFARTEDGSCRITLAVAPRTKKNSTTLGIRQSPQYRAYRDEIVDALAPIAFVYKRPLLTDRPYNIAATYYVDKAGERADKCGLDQGLYDALENAGVISSDWFFRQDDGTRIVFGDELPRVDITITPLQGKENGS